VTLRTNPGSGSGVNTFYITAPPAWTAKFNLWGLY
jgi:hypothetical protein